MIFSLRKLQHLVTLADEANFTRAAAQLGMSQPALSRSIAQLERDAGVPLLDRSRAALSLTAAGEELLAEARRIIGQVGAVADSLWRQGQGESGRVRLGVGPLTANYILGTLLARTIGRWPEMTLTASVQTTAVLIEELASGSLDFCICTESTFQPNPLLESRVLGEVRLGYFVRKEHPLAGPAAASLDALPWDQLRAFPRATGRFRTAAPTGQQIGTFAPLGPTVECDDFGVLRRLMLETDTIWLTSGRVLAAELADGSAVEIRPEEGPNRLVSNVLVVAMRDKALSPAARNVIAVAAEIMVEP